MFATRWIKFIGLLSERNDLSIRHQSSDFDKRIGFAIWFCWRNEWRRVKDKRYKMRQKQYATWCISYILYVRSPYVYTTTSSLCSYSNKSSFYMQFVSILMQMHWQSLYIKFISNVLSFMSLLFALRYQIHKYVSKKLNSCNNRTMHKFSR